MHDCKICKDCKTCKGRGEVCVDIPNHPMNYKRIPCPDCAKEKEAEEVLCDVRNLFGLIT